MKQKSTNQTLFESRMLLVTLMACIAFASLASTPSVAFAQGKKREVDPTLVRLDLVKKMPRATAQSFVGSLQPLRRSVIGSAVEERVDKVFVDEGDFVDSENGLAQLVALRRDTIDLTVAAAEIDLKLSQQVYQELSATIPTQFEAATAEVGRLDAELQYARQVNERLRGLEASGSMSKKEIEESRSQFDSANQAIIAARTELKRLQATSEVRLAIAESNISQQQAKLNLAKDLQSKHTVTAPFSGFVTRKMVEQGNWVTRGTPLVELVQLDPIELLIQVPQEYSAMLQRSFDASTDESPLNAAIEVDSIDQTLQGRVTRVIPDANSRTRTIPVIIQINNPSSTVEGNQGHLLKPGLLAEAVLNIGESEPVLMVPKDALVLDKGTASIYLVDRSTGKPMVKQQSIETGNANGNWIEVIGDVKEGIEVVVQGNERLRDGQEVTVMEE